MPMIGATITRVNNRNNRDKKKTGAKVCRAIRYRNSMQISLTESHESQVRYRRHIINFMTVQHVDLRHNKPQKGLVR